MDAFAEIVGSEHVRTDVRSLRLASSDPLFGFRGSLCRAVVSPGSAEEVARVVRAAFAAGAGIVCRAAGSSCAGGYVPYGDDTVVLDLRRLNRVRQIDLTDQYITVEAGATWWAISAALEGTGLRTVYRPPLARAVATVGGTLSRGSVQDAEGVLGVEAVIGTGKLIRTGSGARGQNAAPFFRHFGPDLTGLLIGDSGTFGVKTAITLALEPLPRFTVHASFAFDTFEATMRALIGCSRLRLRGQVLGIDPARPDNPVYLSYRDTVQALAREALARTRLRGARKEAYQVAAAGRDFLEQAQWTLHLVTEGVSEAAAEEALNFHKEHCRLEGRETIGLLAEALALPCRSARGLFGPNGEKRMSLQGVVPLSAAESAATRVRQQFGVHRAGMEQEQIRESYVLAGYAGTVLLEPSFYWRDQANPLLMEHLSAADSWRPLEFAPNPSGRALAMDLCEGLRTLFAEVGAAHTDIGKLFTYRSALDPQFADAWDKVRRSLDPEDRLNPGNLQR